MGQVACVDINPATVTKLTDRGSIQTVGVVTDAEPFLRAGGGTGELAASLREAVITFLRRLRGLSYLRSSHATARILMCPPDHYGIEYEINPWMNRARGSSRGTGAAAVAAACTIRSSDSV